MRAQLEAKASDLGFSLVGVTGVASSEHMDFYRAWLASGNHGDMTYLARADAIARRSEPSLTMPEAESLIVVAHEY